eukprot:gene323-2482_t
MLLNTDSSVAQDVDHDLRVGPDDASFAGRVLNSPLLAGTTGHVMCIGRLDGI